MLFAIAALAFVLRLGMGLLRGPDFVEQGYSFYADIAQTLVNGGGFCHAPGEDCAIRMPLYPLLVAPFVASGMEYPALVIVQALIGATAPVLAFALAAQLFDRRVGLLTALLVAVDPYAVVHDAAFQETGVLNFLVLLAVLLLSRAAASRSAKLAFGAGIVLALAVLTTARVTPLAGFAVLWMAFGDGLRNTSRHRLAVAVATPIILLVGLWVGRNATVVGTPVLTTETGQSLWFAHNASTMTIYPHRSIDEVREVEWPQLRPETRDHIEAAAADPVREDRAYAALAWSYIREHPGRTVIDALIRVAQSFSGRLSPAHDWPIQLGFMALALPLNVLGLIGLCRAIRVDQAHLVGLLAFASVAVTAAVFWSHTSHQSYLQVFTILYASSLIQSAYRAHCTHFRMGGERTSAIARRPC